MSTQLRLLSLDPARANDQFSGLNAISNHSGAMLLQRSHPDNSGALRFIRPAYGCYHNLQSHWGTSFDKKTGPRKATPKARLEDIAPCLCRTGGPRFASATALQGLVAAKTRDELLGPVAEFRHVMRGGDDVQGLDKYAGAALALRRIRHAVKDRLHIARRAVNVSRS
jgi:hypothetical protein